MSDELITPRGMIRVIPYHQVFPVFLDAARIVSVAVQADGDKRRTVIEVDGNSRSQWATEERLADVLKKIDEARSKAPPAVAVSIANTPPTPMLPEDLVRAYPGEYCISPSELKALRDDNERLRAGLEWLKPPRAYAGSGVIARAYLAQAIESILDGTWGPKR